MSSLNEDAVGTLQPVTPVGEVLSKVDIVPTPDPNEAYEAIMAKVAPTEDETDCEDNGFDPEIYEFADDSGGSLAANNDYSLERELSEIYKDMIILKHVIEQRSRSISTNSSCRYSLKLELNSFVKKLSTFNNKIQSTYMTPDQCDYAFSYVSRIRETIKSSILPIAPTKGNYSARFKLYSNYGKICNFKYRSSNDTSKEAVDNLNKLLKEDSNNLYNTASKLITEINNSITQYSRYYEDSDQISSQSSERFDEDAEDFVDIPDDDVTPFEDVLKANNITNVMESVDNAETVEVWGSFDDVFAEDGDLIEEVADLFTESAKIDDDIKDTISLLNSKGYKTVSSCSGHPSARVKSDGLRDGVMYNKLYSSARVVFEKDYGFSKIPEGWKGKKLKDGNYGIYVEGPTFNILKGMPKDQFYAWKKKYMNSLRSWAKELPKAGGTLKNESATERIESMIDTLMLESMIDII